jgi:hypothetical protein
MESFVDPSDLAFQVDAVPGLLASHVGKAWLDGIKMRDEGVGEVLTVTEFECDMLFGYFCPEKNPKVARVQWGDSERQQYDYLNVPNLECYIL